MSKKVVLGKERILDRWSVLVDGAKGKGGEVIERRRLNTLRHLRLLI